jgi:hypothetical protein
MRRWTWGEAQIQLLSNTQVDKGPMLCLATLVAILYYTILYLFASATMRQRLGGGGVLRANPTKAASLILQGNHDLAPFLATGQGHDTG